MQLPGPGNRPGGEINADAVGRLQGRQQFSMPTPQFQNAFPGRNQKSHEVAVIFAVRSIEPAAATLTRTGFGVVQEFAFPQISGGG
jgi:hypothetical protein